MPLGLKQAHRYKYVLPFAIPVFILFCILLFVNSSFYALNTEALALGGCIELVLTVLWVYFCLIRKAN